MFTVIGQFNDVNAHAIQDFNRFIPSFFSFHLSLHIDYHVIADFCCRHRKYEKMNR